MYIRNEDTIYAPATVPGTGAISVVRLSGPEALNVADKVVNCRNGSIGEAPGYTMKFGTVRTVFDESVVPFAVERKVAVSAHLRTGIFIKNTVRAKFGCKNRLCRELGTPPQVKYRAYHSYLYRGKIAGRGRCSC